MTNSLQNSTRFAARFVNVTVDNASREFGYIALVDSHTTAVISITDYADYVLYRVPRDIQVGAHGNESLYAVAQFLNYIFINKEESFQITSIRDVTKEMFSKFLSDYSWGLITGKTVSKRSLLKKRAVVSSFLEALCVDDSVGMKYLKPGSLITWKSYSTSNYINRIVPVYSVKIRYPKNDNSRKTVNRDMPFAITQRFIKAAEIFDPEITFAIVLMAYVGLRLGEVCNVRQVESCFGKGIRFQYGKPLVQWIRGKRAVKNICESIEIDLNDTKPLRYDGISVGSIKRPRWQRVFSGFTDIVYFYYEKHIRLLSKREIEATRPMFVSRKKDKKSGKYLALTKQSLYLRIMRLFYDHVLPSLASDADPDLQRFYYSMEYHNWGPHAFRHLFTVYLVCKCGVDEVELQTLRGDRSPESARTYLERKGELDRYYKASAESLGNRIVNEEAWDE